MGLYMSSPPIIWVTLLGAVLMWNDAVKLQRLQMACSFLTFSHLGISAMIVSNMVRTQVVSSAATITTLPWLAANSLKSAI